MKHILILLALSLTLLCPQARAQVDPKLARELYERVTPSLVVVQYVFDSELGRTELNTPGVVVDDDGLVLFTGTITPVVIPDAQMKDFKVIIPGDDRKELEATFLGRDDRTNLGFVRAKEGKDWKPLKFEAADLGVGQPIVSVGLLPKDAGYKTYLMSGAVAALLRGPVPQIMVSGQALGGVGSPVFTLDGKAVGFVQGFGGDSPLLDNPRDRGPSFPESPRTFVPASDFLISLSDPPTGKPQALPHLGVGQLSGLTKDVAEYYGIGKDPAIQIGDVIADFPAGKAGLKAGDIILKVNGKPLERGDEPDEAPMIMTRKLLRQKVGDVVTFTILRGKDQPPIEVPVTLGERPKQENRARRFYAEDLGFAAREIVYDDTYVRRLPPETKGVVVAILKPSSSAQNGKLQRGDLIKKLNQTDITDIDQFKTEYETFRKERPRDAVVLEVLRGVSSQIIRIEPPQ